MLVNTVFQIAISGEKCFKNGNDQISTVVIIYVVYHISTCAHENIKLQYLFCFQIVLCMHAFVVDRYLHSYVI